MALIINSGISKGKLKEPLSPMQHLNKCSMFKKSILKLLFDSVISTINAKVDKLADSVATFKASLEYTHKKRR